MAKIKYESELTITDDKDYQLKLYANKTVSYTAIENKTYVVSADSTQIVWDPTTDSTDAISDFDFLYIKPTGDLMVELVTDVGDDNGNEAGTIEVTADTPFVLFSDDSYANVTGVDALGGTADVIDKIRVKDMSSASNTVTVILAT